MKSVSIRRLFFPLALGLAVATGHATTYLLVSAPEAVALLAPPPARNSAEDRLDFENTLAVYTLATPVETALAREENTLTIFHFAPVVGPWLVSGKFPKTKALFEEVEAEAKKVSNEAKKHFQRPRPYHVAPDLFPHSIEHEDPTHFSYPSGHSTRGTLFAILLAEIFPDKREALFAKGREVGWLRVQGGVHYPTDIYAGRVLGQELARDFLRSESFQHDLAEVRAELAAGAR